ncbi:MAG: hypothetical protein ABSD92_09965 [Candidatus Bathyarchaeia archaeon]|jgi:hypothetical protein
MENKFSSSAPSATPSTSLSVEPQAAQVPSKKRLGKKIYIAIAAIATIAVILAAVLLVPQGNASVISLGVQYSAGEKLTYDVTTSMSTQSGNSSTNISSDSNLTVDVVSFDGDTYTLNYTSSSIAASYSVTTSQLIEVKASEMVTVLALLPIGLQLFGETVNGSSPFLAAVFNQSQAQVGDTWQIPLNTGEPSSAQPENLTVTFKDIQDLTVPAGTFKVFRIDFSTNTPASPSPLSNVNLNLSGQSYLEYGTCKQIQSNLQVNISSAIASSPNYNVVDSFTSTLKQDLQP